MADAETSSSFDPDLIHAIFKRVWMKRMIELDKVEDNCAVEIDAVVRRGISKKNRQASANSSALELSSELIRLFVTEAVQRSVTIAEVEGVARIEPSHLERILPQLLLDF